MTGRDPWLLAFSANVRDRFVPRLWRLDLSSSQRLDVVAALAEAVIEELDQEAERRDD